MVQGVIVLTPDELQQLTDRKRGDAQERELRALGIPFGKRTNGSLVVLRSAVEAVLGLRTEVPGTRPRVRLLVRPEPEVQPCRPEPKLMP